MLEKGDSVRRYDFAGDVTSGSNRYEAVWVAAVFLTAASYLALRIPDADIMLSSNDQAYQMALGMAVAKGGLPGFDFITQYGPAAAFASYLGFAATGNDVGELLLSTIGYASAVAIAFVIVRRSVGGSLALVTAAGMLLWFPRFYKWYYSLFPIIGILFAQLYHARWRRGERSRLLLIVWSQFVGLACLFRYDLGLEGGLFGLIAALAAQHGAERSRRRDGVQNLILFACGSLALPLIYTVSIFLARGPHQLLMFLRSIYDGVVDTVDAYRIPPFQFDIGAPLSAQNALALWQSFIPITCLLGGVVGLRILLSKSGAVRSKGYSLFCCSLVGLGVFPQSMHRADLPHLLQVAYPFMMTLTLLFGIYLEAGQTRGWLFKIGGGAAFAVTFATMLRLLPGAAIDLGSVWRDPVHQWRLLANLPASRPGNPTADMAEALRRLTPADAKIFLVMTPTDMPLLFFAQRSQAGIFPVYEKGMFSAPFWLRQNRASLDASPPNFLVTLQTEGDNPAPLMPDLIQEWRSQFKIKVYENARYILLARGAPSK